MGQKITLFIQRRPLASILIGLALILFLVMAFLFLSNLDKGELIISSDNDNTISILKTSDHSIIVQAQGHLQSHLSAGQYIIKVNSRLAAAERLVSVKAHN